MVDDGVVATLNFGRGPADSIGMRHIVHHSDDVPPAPVYDRRRTPERRRVWRGGRRDSDWVNRPPNGLERLERRQAAQTGWRRVLSTLHLWSW